jgi:16S rRNA (guanine966-N2)-methyltransferase
LKHVVRIIGGQYRGKKLSVPEVEGLRPTPDRVRETVFNWLMQDIRDTRCLDAFAGTGALGLEAFSRGASQVVLLEQSIPAHASLQKTITSFDSPRLTLVKTEASAYLRQSKTPFDIIFLDPPFSSDYVAICLDIIRQNNLLTSNGLVYVESASAAVSDGWECIKQKKAGQVFYGLFKLG